MFSVPSFGSFERAQCCFPLLVHIAHGISVQLGICAPVAISAVPVCEVGR